MVLIAVLLLLLILFLAISGDTQEPQKKKIPLKDTITTKKDTIGSLVIEQRVLNLRSTDSLILEEQKKQTEALDSLLKKKKKK